MPTVTLTAPPEPFNCLLCARPEWLNKAGPACEKCPAFGDTHYYPHIIGPEAANLIVVGDVPAPPPKLTLIGGRNVPQQQVSSHQSFEDTAGKVIRTAVDRMISRREFGFVQVMYTYAVKCAVDNPNKKVIQTCSSHLIGLIHRTAARRKATGSTGPLVILACGVDVLSSLGIHAQSEAKCLNRVYENVDVAGIKVQVVFTRSLSSLASQDGKFNTLLADVERACRVATSSLVKLADRSVIEKDYVYPKTIKEVRELVDYVINYTRGVTPANQWKIACDTETNTLHPNWDGTKMLLFSVSWGAGLAGSIALWHKETEYDPAEAYEEVKRLLASRKPVIWFNGKYDYKVFWKLGWPIGDVGNVYWDTFLAEHVLEEDKKKYYSLKQLTKQFIPELAGYEDRLQDMLEAENERTVVADTGDSGKILTLLPAVATALELAVKAKAVSGPGFRASTLEKVIKDWEGDLLKRQDPMLPELRLLLNAKLSGEFRKGAGEKKKAKKETGGFEDVPLEELRFYAAVDVDTTRRLAIQQVGRMRAEDEGVHEARTRITQLQKHSNDPKLTAFPVEILCKTPNALFKLAQDDYLPRQRELAKIEYNGMKVDFDYLRWGSESLGQTITHTRKQIYDLCAVAEEFPLASTQRLAKILFSEGYVHPDPERAQQLADENPTTVFYENGRIRYKPQAYTAKGAIQVTDGVKKSLVTRYKCPLSNLLLAHQKAQKGKNTFFANIEVLASYFGDGKLHAGYGLVNTSTGRLSSSVKIGDARFNAQNIPKGLIGALRNLLGELVLNENNKAVFEGVNCKKLFIPDDDSYCFGNADAKAAEVSIYSAYSHDKALIAALTEGMDAHCFFGAESLNPALVAAGLTGEERRIALAKAAIDDDHAWDYEDFYTAANGLHTKPGYTGRVDKAYGSRLKSLRDNIKRLVFGMLYGAGIKKIAEIAGISLDLAKKIQDMLFVKFPTIRTFMDQTKWELRTFNFVEAFNGRRRRFLVGKGAPNDLRAQAERRAINFKVQGTNSDIVMSVLCWIAPIIENDMRGRLLLTVHDSIGFQVPKKYAHQVKDAFTLYGTKRVAEVFPWMPVPYRWDVELGSSYGELDKADKYVAGLPPPLPEPQLDGYTDEEKDDDLRDPDAFEMPERTKAPKGSD